jgi:hypothetical protein
MINAQNDRTFRDRGLFRIVYPKTISVFTANPPHFPMISELGVRR